MKKRDLYTRITPQEVEMLEILEAFYSLITETKRGYGTRRRALFEAARYALNVPATDPRLQEPLPSIRPGEGLTIRVPGEFNADWTCSLCEGIRYAIRCHFDKIAAGVADGSIVASELEEALAGRNVVRSRR
jgi:hypothetical protein